MQLQPVGPATTGARAGGDAALPHLTASATRDSEARLRGIVDNHIDFVARVLRNAGSPSAEIDDDVQRTFIIAARKLQDVRPGAEKSFILRVALNVAAHARRTLARRREVSVEPTFELADAAASPEQIADRKQARQMLDRILQGMHADLRTVFVLFEIEEMSMIEIAAALGIPQGTVASRLRRARAEFRARTDAIRGRSGSENQP
jgi:RNA polymerase sigma-70 factor (ECF subfamily)